MLHLLCCLLKALLGKHGVDMLRVESQYRSKCAVQSTVCHSRVQRKIVEQSFVAGTSTGVQVLVLGADVKKIFARSTLP